MVAACGGSGAKDNASTTTLTSKTWISFGFDSASDTLKFDKDGTGTIIEKRPAYDSMIEKKFNWRLKGDLVLITTESGSTMKLKLDEFAFALKDDSKTFYGN